MGGKCAQHWMWIWCASWLNSGLLLSAVTSHFRVFLYSVVLKSGWGPFSSACGTRHKRLKGLDMFKNVGDLRTGRVDSKGRGPKPGP